MKSILCILFLIFPFSVESLAQNDFQLLKNALTQKVKIKKILEQKQKEISNKYKGRTVYFLNSAGKSSKYTTLAPQEYTVRGEIELQGNAGHNVFITSDTMIVRGNLKSYVCTDVYQVRQRDRYEKPDALAIKLSDGSSVLVYHNGYCGPLEKESTRVDIVVVTPLGDLRAIIHKSFVTDNDLDSLAIILQKQYSDKMRIKRELDAEMARKKALEEERRRQAEAAEIARLDALLGAYKEKYGDKFGELVFRHEVAIGMSMEACKESLGEPKRINMLEKETSFEYEDILLIFNNSTGELTKTINF